MYFDRIQLLVYVCNILWVIIHKKCKENPQKYTNFNVFGYFSSVLKVFFGCIPWILLKYQLTSYNRL